MKGLRKSTTSPYHKSKELFTRCRCFFLSICNVHIANLLSGKGTAANGPFFVGKIEPKLIRNRPCYGIVTGSVFYYHKTMNTDFVIRLMMCGMTRTEAIIVADEYEDDEQDLLEARIEALEKEKRQERVARIQSLTLRAKSR